MSMNHKRIAVLRGGPSPEYESSLKTGRFIIDNFGSVCSPVDVVVTRDGVWHEMGFEREPIKVLERVDGVINAIHGTYGEDGTLQKLLDSAGLPYSGSNAVSSALSINKVLSKRILSNHGIKTPYSTVIHKTDSDKEVVDKLSRSMPFPIVLKPARSGSKLGVSMVPNMQNVGLSLENAFKYSDSVLVEEYINGTPVTTGVIEGFRDNSHYLLPAIFDIDIGSKEELSRNTSAIFKTLGLRDYATADFILHPKRGLYFLEVNTVPKISDESFFKKSLEHVGSSVKEFVSHLLGRVFHRKA